MFTRRHASLAACLILSAGLPTALADHDGNIEWDLLSHNAAADRTPLAPTNGGAFDIRFQTAHFDVVTARVGIDENADGIDIVWTDAAFDSTTGPIDSWTASIPATSADTIAYIIELTDGTDTDYLSATGPADTLPAANDWFTLDFNTLAHASYGASIASEGVVFRVWAPNATSAAVRGDFNNWSPSAHTMTRLGEDFIVHAPTAGAGDRYKFYFNNNLWQPDAQARELLGSQNYNSVVNDPNAYQWQNPNFSPAPPEEWVVYQLHVGTFSGGNGDPLGTFSRPGRFTEVADRVQHLKDLGVNAVMLNPINEFPTPVSGGYNSIAFHAPESSYGSPDDLKVMIDALHGAGIAVILDMVWNHLSSSDNFLWNYDGSQHYFDTPQVDTPWGPQTDMDNPNVRDFFLTSVETTMGEWKIDGYRHDAIYEMVSNVQWAGGQQLVNDSMSLLRNRFPDTHVVGEIYNNSAWNTSPSGINLDGQYHEAFKNAVYQAVEDAAFGDPNIWSLANAIDGSGPWVEGDRVFNYYELHDEAWSLSGDGRTRAVRRIDPSPPHDSRWALGRTKLANGITILAQGMPAILMGTEWAEDNSWETAKLDWTHKDTYAGIVDYYRDLISLRTTKRALFANSPANVFHVNDGANVFAFERTGWDNRSYVVVANFSNTDFAEYIIGLPRSGDWGVIVNSEDTAYQGTGFGDTVGDLTVDNQPRDGFAQSVRLQLPAHGLLLLQHDPEYLTQPCPGDTNGDNAVTALDISNVLASFGTTTTEGPAAGDVNADGQVTALDISFVLSAFGSTCN